MWWCCGAKQVISSPVEESKHFHLLERKPGTVINRTKIAKHLIVDDSSFNRLVLKRFLNIMGIIVDEVGSAEEALQMIVDNGEYAVVWSDFNLGSNGSDLEIDGAQLTRLLRTGYDYNGSIVIVTGFIDESVRKKCMASGATHFLTKPIDRARIREYSALYTVSKPNNTTDGRFS